MDTAEIMEIALEMAELDEIPGDSAIHVPGKDIQRVLIGIDMWTSELLLARELNYDLVIAHHPPGGVARINFDQVVPSANRIPANGGFENWFRVDQPDGIFSYTGGLFTRETTDGAVRCCGICKDEPFSLNNGSFIVNISGTGNANASGVEWHVGLSRYINNPEAGYRVPSYNEWIYDDSCGGILV